MKKPNLKMAMGFAVYRPDGTIKNAFPQTMRVSSGQRESLIAWAFKSDNGGTNSITLPSDAIAAKLAGYRVVRVSYHAYRVSQENERAMSLKFCILEKGHAWNENMLHVFDSLNEREDKTKKLIYGDDECAPGWEKYHQELTETGSVEFEGDPGLEWFTAHFGDRFVAVPVRTAQLIRRVFVPQNPKKMRSAAVEVIEAAKEFIALVERA